jgi:hypothetical protein
MQQHAAIIFHDLWRLQVSVECLMYILFNSNIHLTFIACVIQSPDNDKEFL